METNFRRREFSCFVLGASLCGGMQSTANTYVIPGGVFFLCVWSLSSSSSSADVGGTLRQAVLTYHVRRNGDTRSTRDHLAWRETTIVSANSFWKREAKIMVEFTCFPEKPSTWFPRLWRRFPKVNFSARVRKSENEKLFNHFSRKRRGRCVPLRLVREVITPATSAARFFVFHCRQYYCSCCFFTSCFSIVD